MAEITFQAQRYVAQEGETLLACLLRNGVDAPNSCRTGVCQSCLMRAVEGPVPTAAQNGLKETLKAQGYFLPCLCMPTGDMTVSLPGSEIRTIVQAEVVRKEPLSPEILRLCLQPNAPFSYRAGQFVQVRRPDGLTRSYSVASVPGRDTFLELHVRCLEGGQMSQWIRACLEIGDTIEISGPAGDCFYLPDDPEQPLLLIGTGTGLAPLYGIVRDALAQGHTGPIALFHGSWEPSGLYLVDELRALADQHPHFSYTPCVDRNPDEIHTMGRADSAAFCRYPKLKDWRVYLCGHPDMVKGSKKKAFLAGAAIKDIFADPFVLSAPTAPTS